MNIIDEKFFVTFLIANGMISGFIIKELFGWVGVYIFILISYLWLIFIPDMINKRRVKK